MKFIRDNYPDVIKRRDHKFGFMENIWRNYGGLLPTIQRAYCCKDYKHNPKYVDKCSITGVRRAESASRKNRKTIEVKNKTTLKQNKALIDDYFEEHCQSVGSTNVITLKPIIDWTDEDVWDYIKRHDLPINPEYKKYKRIGCIVCPKANFTSNVIALMEMPKLVDAFIKAHEKENLKVDWVITSENRDCEDDKCYYICRWLNHSFMPFSKRQEELYKEFRRYFSTILHKRCDR